MEGLSELVDVRGRRRFRLARALLWLLLTLLFRVEVRGLDRLPKPGPIGCVVASSHLGWPDAILIVTALPAAPRVNFVADAGFVAAGGWRWWAARQVGGVLPVVGEGRAHGLVAAAARACLARGAWLCVFPEGRYGSAEGTLQPFHRGFARAALAAGAPIVPVAVSGTRDLWLRKRLVLAIGEAIEPAGRDVDALVDVTRERIRALRVPEAPPRGPRPFRRRLSRAFS